VVFSFVGLVEQTDDHERHGGRKNLGDRSELHHNYRLNLRWPALGLRAEP
jgi:hypothetical protein